MVAVVVAKVVVAWLVNLVAVVLVLVTVWCAAAGFVGVEVAVAVSDVGLHVVAGRGRSRVGSVVVGALPGGGAAAVVVGARTSAGSVAVWLGGAAAVVVLLAAAAAGLQIPVVGSDVPLVPNSALPLLGLY